MSLEQNLMVLGLPATCRSKKAIQKAYHRGIDERGNNSEFCSAITKAYLNIKTQYEDKIEA